MGTKKIFSEEDFPLLNLAKSLAREFQERLSSDHITGLGDLKERLEFCLEKVSSEIKLRNK